jgi:carbon-monoxide dehydrogenase medium subunit
VKASRFRYHAPTSAAEAASMLTELGDTAKVLAGGQSLIPMMAMRLAAFDDLIDITRVADFRGVERRDGGVWIGAATTQAKVAASDAVGTSVPMLRKATKYIGHFQIRNRGTLGGSIAHADPAAEYPAVALALDAEMTAVSSRGTRTIPASEFFTGLWSTALDGDELLTGVTFPSWSGRCGFGVHEMARRHGDFAIAGAVVGVSLDGDDRVQRCAIGLMGLGSTPERAVAAAAAATGRPRSEVGADEIGRLATAGLESVPSDLHGSTAMRVRVGAVLVARAWDDAVTEALHG